MKNHVRFDYSYFKKVINEYKDWKMAFFRECAQNAIDANATEVRFYINKLESGEIEVSCIDNGKGMTSEIILNKFLVMGGSHKEEGNVGGFGYAKSIILFCHEEYSIQSQDNFVHGSYGSYNDLVKTEEYFQGTKIKVIMDRKIVREYELRNRINLWVQNTNLPKVKFFINDEEIEIDNTKMKYKSDIDIGKLSFIENNSNFSSIWIRMRGMPMFEKVIYDQSSTFKGYIDLDFESSRDCLTSNRDGLLNSQDISLNKLLQDLTSERSKFTNDSMTEFVLNKSIVPYFSDEVISFDPVLNSNNLENTTEIEDTNEKTSQTEENNLSHAEYLSQSLFHNLKKKKEEKVFSTSKIANTIDNTEYPKNFMIKLEAINDETDARFISRYKKMAKILNQKRNIKLANKIDLFVRDVLEALSNDNHFHLLYKAGEYYYNGYNINTGFLLAEESDTYGLYTFKNEQINVLINVINFRKESFDDYDLRHILIHEIAHIFESYHNDYHASLMFKIERIIRKNKIKFK